MDERTAAKHRALAKQRDALLRQLGNVGRSLPIDLQQRMNAGLEKLINEVAALRQQLEKRSG